MASDQQRFKAQEIERSIKLKQDELDKTKSRINEGINNLESAHEAKKKASHSREYHAGDRDKDGAERAENLRRASELKSEAVHVEHKIKDRKKQLHKIEEDVKFETKEMQKQADKLKI